MQAIAALEHIGSLVLFLVDESESCGTPYEEQMNLLHEVQTLLPDTELMLVTSKADLLDPLPPMWEDVKAEEAAWRAARANPSSHFWWTVKTGCAFLRPKTLGWMPCDWKLSVKSRLHDPTTRWNSQRDGTDKMPDHIDSIGTMPSPTMPSRSVVRASSDTAK